MPEDLINSAASGTVVINQQYFHDKRGQALIEESPHLKHAEVGALCGQLATYAWQRALPAGRPPQILDMGAGEGMLTQPFLEKGAFVTAADASDELLQGLREKAGLRHEALRVMPGDIFDSLAILETEQRQFDIVCASSFLHHIPDYLELCRRGARLVRPGGVLFTVQDPLRYDTLGKAVYAFDRASYFWWRLFQGNYMRGLQTRMRRLTGNYRDDLAADTAEYHVVRNGVDQLALQRFFTEAGFDCSIHTYWSTQSTFFQRLGQRLQCANTFGVLAQKKK